MLRSNAACRVPRARVEQLIAGEDALGDECLRMLPTGENLLAIEAIDDPDAIAGG